MSGFDIIEREIRQYMAECWADAMVGRKPEVTVMTVSQYREWLRSRRNEGATEDNSRAREDSDA